MHNNIPLEIKVIQKYIINDKQDRYIQFVSSKDKRYKFIKDLPHFRYFKWEILEKQELNEIETITSRLKKIKLELSNCYVISENTNIDTKIIQTSVALKETIGYGMATILVFGNADLIYFEDEEPNERFISKL